MIRDDERNAHHNHNLHRPFAGRVRSDDGHEGVRLPYTPALIFVGLTNTEDPRQWHFALKHYIKKNISPLVPPGTTGGGRRAIFFGQCSIIVHSRSMAELFYQKYYRA